MPDRQQALVVSQPARFEINHGSADNISFFVNVTFRLRENIWCRRWLTRTLVDERILIVSEQQLIAPEEESEAVN